MKTNLSEKEIGVLVKVGGKRGLGFRTRASLGSADRATADRLVRKKLLRVEKREGKYPKRYVVTLDGQKAAKGGA